MLDNKETIDKVQEIMIQSFKDTTEFLGIRLPITGTPMVGANWSLIK